MAAIALGAAAYLLVHDALLQHAIAPAPTIQPTSVTVATVARQDVPIYLNGLGTVQASNTIAIHTQIDGKLQSVRFVEGQEVHKGDILVQIDPRYYQAALDQVKAKQAEDEAQLVSAQKDLERFQTLVSKSFETQQNLDHQDALVGQLKATIEADKAAIESAQIQLDYTTIPAPIDGRVGLRQIDAGNIVHVTDTTPIVVLTQTKPIGVVFSLPERTLDSIRVAMRLGPLDVVALDQDNQKELGRGSLLLVDNIADATTGTVRLKAAFPNDDERLWPGQFVNVRLLLKTERNALTIPSAAVQRGPQGLYAWLVTREDKTIMRPVQVGSTFAGHTIVTNGLSDGDRVVVDGQSKLEPGTRVAVAPVRQPIVRSSSPGLRS
jgi:multidrug efflux system membrane fusion protein